MSPRRGTRTQPCGLQEARTRLASAEKFLDVARLIGHRRRAARGLRLRRFGDGVPVGRLHRYDSEPSAPGVRGGRRAAPHARHAGEGQERRVGGG